MRRLVDSPVEAEARLKVQAGLWVLQMGWSLCLHGLLEGGVLTEGEGDCVGGAAGESGRREPMGGSSLVAAGSLSASESVEKVELPGCGRGGGAWEEGRNEASTGEAR